MNRPHHHSLSPDGAVHCVRRGESLSEYEEPSSFTYAAFISYRHLPRDTEVAQQAQKAIETYRLPRGVVAEQPGDEGNSAARSIRSKTRNSLGKCFRDEDELAASPSLPDSIQEALAQSRSLIVVCSPETQESAWIQREIETFIALHGRERIICVLAAGSPEESIPSILKTRMMPDAAGIMREMPAEPLAADLRPESKDKRKAELLRIIAAVIGCNYDGLRRRERSRRHKRLFSALLTAGALIALVSFLSYSTLQSSEAALIADAKRLAAQSQEYLTDGHRIQAIEAALEALPSSESDSSKPLVPEAQKALEDALLVYPDLESPWRPFYEIETETPLQQFVATSAYPLVSTLDSSGHIDVFSIPSGAYYLTINISDYLPDGTEFVGDDWLLEPATNGILVARGKQPGLPLLCFQTATGQLLWEHENLPTNAFTLSEDKQSCAIASWSEGALTLMHIDLDSGDVLHERAIEIPKGAPTATQYACCSNPANSALFLAIDEHIYRIPWNQDEDIATLAPPCLPFITSLRYHANSVVATSCEVIGAEGFPGYHAPYRVTCYSTEREAWEDDGTFNATFTRPVQEQATPFGRPEVWVFNDKENAAAICSAGEDLKAYDLATGAVQYSQAFSSAIICLDTIALNDEPFLLVATADGTIDVQLPSDIQDLMGRNARATLPFTLQKACFIYQDGYLVVFVQPTRSDNELLAYMLDLRQEAQREWSLDEMIDYANSYLDRRKAFALKAGGPHPL